MDDIIKKMYEDDPLLAFSLFTPRYVNIVKKLGEEILVNFSNEAVKKGEPVILKREVMESTDNFWLFVLSSYEVLRTLCQNKNCFKSEIAERICTYKNEINQLRIPFAKLEVAGKKDTPVYYESCLAGISNQDYSYIIKGKSISAKKIITGFISLMDDIKLSDIVDSYDRIAREKLGMSKLKYIDKK